MQGWGGTRHIWRGVRSTAECWLRWLCGEHDEADSHLPTMQIWAVPESRKNDAKTSHHTTRNYPAGSMDTDHCSWEIPVLVFALLPNKTKATYRRFFSILKSAVNDRQSVLTPESWMIDFETAARNAWKETFPNTTIRGCFFHFTQCVWRKIQNCCATTEFRDNDSFHQLVRRAAVLPLVPSQRVEDVWFQALEDNDDNTAAVVRFKDYVTETWIEGLFEFWIEITLTMTAQEPPTQWKDSTTS